MGRTQRNCPVFGCGSSNLAKLLNHLAQVHNMDAEERKKWFKWSKIGICVPLRDKDGNEKDIHMANTLERLVNLLKEMATNFTKVVFFLKEKVQGQNKLVNTLMK